MTLSESKGVLRACAIVAGCGAVLSVVLSVWLLFGGTAPPSFELLAMSLVFLALLCSLAAVLLLTEHTRASTDTDTRGDRKPGLRRRELSGATRHCPGKLKIAALVGILFATLQFLRIGDVSAPLGQALTASELRGFLAGATFFFCLAFPVITSAALMDGGYGDWAWKFTLPSCSTLETHARRNP